MDPKRTTGKAHWVFSPLCLVFGDLISKVTPYSLVEDKRFNFSWKIYFVYREVYLVLDNLKVLFVFFPFYTIIISSVLRGFLHTLPIVYIKVRLFSVTS